MKRWFVLIGAALFVAATTTAESCDTGKETKDTVEEGEEAGQEAKLGDPLTLEGFGKLSMKVTPTKLLDPLDVSSFDKPLNKKARFVGVDVEMTNVGSKTYSDSPSNGAKVITKDSQQGDGTIVSSGPCSGGFSSDATISPGDTLQGCIPFEVPGDSPVETFQFTLESGFGPQAGEWSIQR